MASPQPYRLDIPQSALDDLRQRLQNARLPDHIPGAGWDMGTEPSYLQDLLEYWQNTFDWRAQEALINQTLNHFTLHINTINLHFVHQRSQSRNAIPLILIHGWPGSFLEFTEIIPKLTDPGEGKQAFHVVAPSLPGFGLSSAPKQPGFGLREIARTFNQLMLELGYNKYVAQGGDWGAMLSKALGLYHSDYCQGIHVNRPMAEPQPHNPLHILQYYNAFTPILDRFPILLSRKEIQDLKDSKHWQDHEFGYNLEQSTKPQTLGYALNDSPAGLLAYIVEKFHGWSDRRGSNGKMPFSKDFLLTNVCLYWLTGNVTSSLRIYYESRYTGDKQNVTAQLYCKVPSAIAVFPKEIQKPPQSWGRSMYNVQQWSILPRGGHFAAKEEPDVLAQDVQKFFGNKVVFPSNVFAQQQL